MFYSSRLRPLTRESAYAPASPHHLTSIGFKKIRHLHSTLIFFVSPSAAPLRYAGIGVRTCFASSFGNRMFQNNTSFTFHLHFSKIVPRTDARILPSENSHPLFRFEENSRVVKKHDVFSQRSCLRPLHFATRESAYALASPHHLATVCFKIIRHLHSA